MGMPDGVPFFRDKMTNNSLTTIKCPCCRKETPWEGNPDRPFCSERCKMIDLGAWASEEYRVAGEKKQPADEEEE